MADEPLPFRQDDRPLRCLFLDLNAYFASVEQAEDARLRGRPIGVCPVMADSSFIIAASYEAKRFGVKTGTQIGEAKRMCPDILLLPARPPLYVNYHNRIIEAAESVLPVEKVCSIDEMRFSLIGKERERSEAEKIARRMKAAIQDRVAPNLTSSVGIAPNAFLAKVGTDMQKPDGLVILEAKDLPQALYGLGLTEFAGINRRMAARLKAAGIFTAEDLTHASRQHLLSAFGSVVGERWWYLLRGYELDLPEHDRKSLGHSHVLAPALRSEEGVREVLLRLLAKAAARLRAVGLVASSMTVVVQGFERSWKAHTKLDPTHDTVALTREVLRLWEGRDFAKPKLVGITFHDLNPPEYVTPSLFEQGEDRSDLSSALDAVNQKFGKNTVYLAATVHAKDAADEKIAFDKTWLFSEGKGDNEWTGTRTPREDRQSKREAVEQPDSPPAKGDQTDLP